MNLSARRKRPPAPKNLLAVRFIIAEALFVQENTCVRFFGQSPQNDNKERLSIIPFKWYNEMTVDIPLPLFRESALIPYKKPMAREIKYLT